MDEEPASSTVCPPGMVVHAGGARALHIVQVYGESSGPRSADYNLSLVMEAVAWLRSLGDVPARPASPWLARSGLDWHGLAALGALAGSILP